jgi:hypothetical protein
LHSVAVANSGGDVRQKQIAGSLVFLRIAVTNKIAVQMFSQRALLSNRLG